MESQVVSTKGWNWGHYQLDKENMVFNVNNQKCFVINYKDIALSNATGKNEVGLEFQQPNENRHDKHDILCEMRFYVPNSELDSLEEEKKEQEKKAVPKEEKKKKEERKGSDAGQSGDDEDDDEDEDEEEDMITPAQSFNEKIIKAAGIGEFAGEMIASLSELPMIVPRGKYSFQLYSTFAKLHGKTNDYKIQYKDITKGFLLPKPNGIHMVYVLHLKVPLRQGQTLHHFIALQFEKETKLKVSLNLSPEQIKEQYEDRLQPELEGPLYDVISKLFKELIKINILIPSEFKSSKKEEAIKCSVKASDGYLYPFKSSLIFIHKPVIYIKHSEIKYVEFSRIGQVSGMPSRSFDMTITKIKDDSSITFAGIDKAEHKGLSSYLKSKNIKMRSVDVETKQQIDFDDEDEDQEEEEEEEKASQKGVVSGKRIRKPVQNPDMLDEDYDSEEDESFNEDASPEQSDEDEANDDDDEDVSMDEDLDDEVKELQKSVPKVQGKRGKQSENADKKPDDKKSSSKKSVPKKKE